MPEEQLIKKLKELKKELNELDTKITTKERKLCAERGGQNNKELDDLKRQRDEIQKESSSLQKYVNLQGKSEMNERKVQELKNQIKNLEKKNEMIGELHNKKINELKEKKEELERTIIQLKSEIKDLNKKIKENDDRLLSLKNEIEVNEINHQNRIRDITAEHDSEIKELRFQTITMIKKQANNHQTKMDELLDSNKFLENEVQELKEVTSKTKEELNSLKNVATGTCEVNQHILYIGQVCLNLQTNWYCHVMPNHCIDMHRAYKVKDIEEDLNDPEMFPHEEEQTQAKTRWEQLQKKVNWKKNKRLLGVIKRLQYKRNQVAHPTITEEGAKKAMEELEKQGELTSKPSAKDVQKLIELWVSSKSS